MREAAGIGLKTATVMKRAGALSVEGPRAMAIVDSTLSPRSRNEPATGTMHAEARHSRADGEPLEGPTEPPPTEPADVGGVEEEGRGDPRTRKTKVMPTVTTRR